MDIVESAKMGKNEYFLENLTDFTQPLKLVADIAELYALKYSSDLLTAKYIIKLKKILGAVELTILSAGEVLFAKNIDLLEIPEHKHKQQVKLSLFLAFRQIFPARKIAWGILRGVRPLKLVSKLLKKFQEPELVRSYLIDNYALTAEKATLAIEVARAQNHLLAGYGKQDISIYIGIPYCNTKCSYCSFPSSLLPNQAETIEIFLQTIEQDIQNVLQLTNEYNLNVACLYIGGGTPTSFSETHFRKFVDILKRYFPRTVKREFTFEAGRVDSLSKLKLEQMHVLGINRISLNPQTLNEKTLKLIGRQHSLSEFYKWYYYVKTNYPEWTINADIILGLPQENIEDVRFTLSQLKEFTPHNITIHTLAFKKGTELFQDVGRYYEVNTLSQMATLASDFMQKLNQEAYYLYRQHYILGNLENIGYAVKGYECVYNAMIMSEEFTVLGVGPSATTKIISENGKITTFFMPKNVETYISEIENLLTKREQLFRNAIKKQE